MNKNDYKDICYTISYRIDRKRRYHTKGFDAFDLRGLENAPADFRVDLKSDSLFFNIIENTNKIVLSGSGKYYNYYSNDSDTPTLEIPKEFMGYTLTRIGEYAFADGLYSTKNIIIPDSVEIIGAWAFKNCKSITFINIPNGLKRIEKGAFHHCDSLSKVYIPQTVSYIGYGAFSACSSLLSIKVDQNNAFYDSRDDCNAIIHTASDKMIALCKYTVFPNTVKDIDYSVSMESTMQEMSNLKECVVLRGETSIGKKAFANCHNLEIIIIPDTIKEIGAYAFQNCTKLKKIVFPESLERIGEGAFQGCAHLFSVMIPRSTITIEANAFSYCSSLVSIVVDNNNAVYCSDNKCNGIVEIKTKKLTHGCSVTIIPSSVRHIGQFAFVGCVFRSIIIPDTVESIDHEAFVDCLSLGQVLLNNFNIKYFSDSFSNCPYLTLKKSSSDSQSEFIPISQGGIFSQKRKRKHKQNSQPLSFNRKSINEEGYRKYYRDLFENELQHTDSSRIHEFSKVFDGILYNLVNQKIELDNPNKSFQQVFIDLMAQNYGQFSKWQFIKYINIYNNIDEVKLGRIRFYSDFIHSYDTDRINDCPTETLCSIDSLFREKSIYGKVFEYCTSYTKPLFVDENEYFAICKSDTNEVVYSVALGNLLFDGTSRQACHKKKSGFNLWLETIDNMYIERNDVTNFYYFTGNIGDLETEELDKAVICSTVGIDYHEENPVLIRLFLNEYKRFIEQTSYRIVYEIKNYQLRKEAIKAAFAQVMARNMSHNIGSHVFSNLISNDAYSKLTDENILKTKAYVSPWDTEREYPKEQVQILKSNSGNFQLSYFNQYLKSRMDYLSEVTFGTSNMLTTKYMYSDVFKELDRVRILLNYISGIQGFKYTFCLKRNGVVLENENDIAIAFPSDVLGSQAFYNIIENIIRNTAKHACNNKRDIVTFTIEFTDIEDYPKYYCVEIDNGIEESDANELAKKQNIRINTSVLDKDNNLRSHSLGLLEMEASAAFLRQVDIAKVDSYEYHFEDMDEYKNKYNNLILLKAINKNGSLGYRFFVQKPKEFLLVGNFDVADSKKDAVGKEGVQFISEEDFAKAMSDGKSFAHPFLLYSNNVSDKTKVLLSNDNDCKTLLPIRKLGLVKDEINELVAIINGQGNIVLKLKAFAWNKYMQSIGLESDDIYIGEVVGRRKFSNCRQVVFTNHGKNFENYLGNVKELPELWLDSLSSYRQGKLPLFASYSLAEGNTEEPLTRYVNTIPPQLKMEIFEAYHNKVVALDERIQHFSLESYEGSISASTLFNATNVIIPKTKLDPEQFDESMIHELEIFINNEINGAFLLVHYGILERMYKTEKAISEHIEAWAKKAKRVVVTSGRGSHSLQLPASVCFANLSSVLNAFTESRCKFLINCLINQSRRKNE